MIGDDTLTDMKKLHNFATKWANKFKDEHISFVELFDQALADDCASLGFEHEYDNIFEVFYGEAFSDSKELNKIKLMI